MKKIKLAYVVDSMQYIKQEPYQHQLYEKLNEVAEVEVFEMKDVISARLDRDFDKVLSCLKLKTIYRNIENLKKFFNDKKLVVYEQDPWENYRDDGVFKGAYDKIINNFNVDFIANTTKWWADYGKKNNYPTKFVKMGILPKYCTTGPKFVDRKFPVGFIGAVYDYRKQVLDIIREHGIHVEVPASERAFSYQGFLNKISDFKIYAHNEEKIFTHNNKKIPISSGLWVKDLDAAARGCFSIRNYHSQYDSVIDENIQTVKLFGHPLDAINVVEDILSMNEKTRQNMIDDTVSYLKSKDIWKETSEVLVGLREEVK